MTQRLAVVAFNGVSLGIMSFAFGVFHMAKSYGVLPDLDVQVVSGEPAAALTGAGLRTSASSTPGCADLMLRG